MNRVRYRKKRFLLQAWTIVLAIGGAAGTGWADDEAKNAPTLCFKEVNGDLISVPCPGSEAPSAGAVPRSEPPPAGTPSMDETRAMIERIAGPGDESAALDLFETLVAQGVDIVPGLVTVFQDAKAPYEQRWVAGRALGRIPCQASVAALSRGLKDKASMVRMAAAVGLKDSGARSAVPALVSALDDPAAMVRASVLDALGALGSQQQVSVVAAELTAPHNFVKGTGLFVRVHAVQALANLGGADAVAALVTVADDADATTRDAARAALLKLTGRSDVPPGQGTVGDRWRRWWAEQGGVLP